jgi:hypothetical protein
MENENLSLEYNKILLTIKAINSSKNMKEAADKLGVKSWSVYNIVNFANIKIKKGKFKIEPGQKFRYKDEEGNTYFSDPI